VDDSQIRALAERWASEDPDPETQAELRTLLAEGDATSKDLLERFAGSLEFGTAGLRGVLGAGPNRMNRAVVIRTTWAWGTYLLREVPDAKSRGVVIGYDGRRLSREFAEDTAGVLAAMGIRALLFRDVVPTPVCAFAVAETGAAGGVMVTASHNPPEYNGYKVYWSNAAQIVPPVDVGVASLLVGAKGANAIERMPLGDARAKGLVEDLGEGLEAKYLARVRALSATREGQRAIRIVYTPLHGVGDRFVRAALAQAGFTAVTTVPEQQAPDPAFPTVAFPNPEEKGAMDLAFALARAQKADLVLANDPDADRLAVAVPDASSPSGYQQLTGNQVGVLLGHYLLTEGHHRDAPNRLALASCVSSPMLGEIARKLGVHYEETLTGFKWIANRAMELARERGLTFVFGYEEALGYTPYDLVRDKDGVSAAVLVAELTAVLAARGETVLGALEALYRRYGLYVSGQVNVTKKGVTGAEEIRALMDRLRKNPPQAIGSRAVVAASDFEAQERVELATGKRETLPLPKSNVLVYELEGGSRVIARPSGTEPKIKYYFDVREEVRGTEPMAHASVRAEATMQMLKDAFVALTGG
jgi:phosphomannomutase